MKIAIIGGGLTGLTAAYELGKAGNEVSVFEKENYLGGLACGFKEKGWDWHLEKAYHHLFTNDASALNLLTELGLKNKIIIKRPITSTLLPTGKIVQLDSPQNLLTFPGLSLIDKLRTGVLLAFLKLNPFWQPLENITAKNLFITVGGKAAWTKIWEPLMLGKFGKYVDTVAASWLWARIKKRTPNLCYIEGGFQTLVDTLEQVIKQQGGKIYTDTTISSIKQNNHQFTIDNSQFDRVLLTVPTPIALKLVPDLLPTTYSLLPNTIPHLSAQTLILETTKPILDKVYWLNVNDRSFPFLALVAHTNFMNSSHYNGHHLTYFGNYLPPDHPYLKMTREELLKEFTPFIQRLNSQFKFDNLVNWYLFSAPFAQPVHQLHYSKIAPKLITPIGGLYLANLDSIYPWDRGTNYAIELGQKAAKEINN